MIKQKRKKKHIAGTVLQSKGNNDKNDTPDTHIHDCSVHALGINVGIILGL
jgi:hypothetical protein